MGEEIRDYHALDRNNNENSGYDKSRVRDVPRPNEDAFRRDVLRAAGKDGLGGIVIGCFVCPFLGMRGFYIVQDMNDYEEEVFEALFLYPACSSLNI